MQNNKGKQDPLTMSYLCKAQEGRQEPWIDHVQYLTHSRCLINIS